VIIAFLLFVLLLSFYFLAVIADEYFVPSLDIIAEKLKLSPEVAGATFMAVGSSAPEFFTSLIAVLKVSQSSDIGSGTIVGSAIFNILVIIGASAMFKKAVLTWQPVIRDLIFYSLSIVLLLVSFWDGKIVLLEAVSFVVLYAVYVYSVTQWSKWLKYTPLESEADEIEEELEKHKVIQLTSRLINFVIPQPAAQKKKYILTFINSIIAIALMSFILVESAVMLGHKLQINETIIALTVLAAGTSVPDLLASIIVAKKGRGDMAISNAVGSNIFDILFGLGVPWGIAILLLGKTIHVGTQNLMSSVFLLFATVLAVFFILAIRKWSIGPRAGLLLIFTYLGYLLYQIAIVLT
jgi:K+-dependent Na+/Ca+ exchanger-like protein